MNLAPPSRSLVLACEERGARIRRASERSRSATSHSGFSSTIRCRTRSAVRLCFRDASRSAFNIASMNHRSTQFRFGGWQLNAEYAQQFGIEPLNWPPQAAQKP